MAFFLAEWDAAKKPVTIVLQVLKEISNE